MANYDPFKDNTKSKKKKNHELDDDDCDDGYTEFYPSKEDHLDHLPDQDDDCE